MHYAACLLAMRVCVKGETTIRLAATEFNEIHGIEPWQDNSRNELRQAKKEPGNRYCKLDPRGEKKGVHCPLRAFSCALASRAALTKGARVDRSTHCFMKSC
jgi:hypothetical protein